MTSPETNEPPRRWSRGGRASTGSRPTRLRRSYAFAAGFFDGDILVSGSLDHPSRPAWNGVGSTFTPGPCVVEIVIDLRYVPFAVAGLSLTRVSISARRFVDSCSGLNDALPNGVWMMPAFSTR